MPVWLGAGDGCQASRSRRDRPPSAAVRWRRSSTNTCAKGSKSNLSLRAQSLEVERSVAALDEARARYFPEVGLDARYTRAEGGRTIELPLGQALNPAYQTLNDLLVAQGQQPQFPVVQDETIAFLREREQDTRITLRMPLVQPAIPAAVRAQRELLGASEYAHVALGAPPQARHHRGLPALALGGTHAGHRRRQRGAAQRKPARQRFPASQRQDHAGPGAARPRRVAGRDPAVARSAERSRRRRRVTSISCSTGRSTPRSRTPTWRAEVTARTRALADLRAAALANRPELAELTHLTRASEAQVSIAKADRWPTLSLGADGGIQGEEYEFGRGSNYATVSLLLNWTFFDGGARRAAVRQASAIARRTATQLDELTQQVQLEVQQSLDRLNTSADSLATADARAEAARAAFRIASRKRDEGAISQVEFIDARSSLTSAELNLNVTRFSVLARQAELDYATAAGTLPLPARLTSSKDIAMKTPRIVALGHCCHRAARGLRQAAPRPRPTGRRRCESSTRAHGPAVPPIDTNGIVVTKHEMRLSFKMGGVVRRIYVQEGDVVKQGQRLAEIELTEVSAQVEQARQMADKAAARSQARRESLRRPGHQPRAAAGPAHPGRDGRARSIKSAQFNLGYSVISAPRDGKVLRKLAEERELVPAGSPGAGVRRKRSRLRGARRARRSRNRQREARRQGRDPHGRISRPAHDRHHRRDRERRRRAHRNVSHRSAIRFAATAAGQRPGDAPASRAHHRRAAAHLRADGRAGRRRRRSRQRVRDRRRQGAAPRRARRLHHRRQHRARERPRDGRSRGHRRRAVPRERRGGGSPARHAPSRR